MRTKQFGTLPLLVLAIILAVTIVVGIGVIAFLDKSMIAKTVSKAEARKQAITQPSIASGNTQDAPTIGAAEHADAIKKAIEASERLRRSNPLPSDNGAQDLSNSGSK